MNMEQQRPKILFVLPSLGGGGAEGVTVTLLQYLDRSHFEPHLALVKAEGTHLESVPPDIPLHNLKMSRARYAIPSFVRLAWKLRPQIILSTLGYLNLTLLCARNLLPRGTRFVARESTIVSELLATDVSHSWIWRLLYRRLYPKADMVVCQSDYMLEDLARSFSVPREKMVRIYNPVDLPRINGLSLAKPNPYTGAGPQLLAIGRLSREKGYDLLLDAMALVHEVIRDAKLTVLGAGPQETDLVARQEKLGLTDVVRFMGFEPNPYPYLRHADLFLFASRYEGFPNSLLEAVTLGRQIVATDCPGGVREILSGYPGCQLVKGTDPQALAHAILEKLNGNQRPTYPTEIPHFMKEFDVRRITAQYEALLQKVMDARPV